MLISYPNTNSGYLVYITASKRKRTYIGLSYEMNCFRIEAAKRFSRLVYFEKFIDKNKAMRKKRDLEKMNSEKISKLVSKSNPEWLDIIFTLTDTDS